MSESMKQAIRDRHRYSGGLLFFELRSNTGYACGEPQRIDAFHMHEVPSKLLMRTAYEIKVSRADFLSEIRKPVKRRFALRVSNRFYFVAPSGLISVEEVPQECGLLEVGIPGERPGAIRETVPAPFRDTPPPTWGFVTSIARALGKSVEETEARP